MDFNKIYIISTVFRLAPLKSAPLICAFSETIKWCFLYTTAQKYRQIHKWQLIKKNRPFYLGFKYLYMPWIFCLKNEQRYCRLYSASSTCTSVHVWVFVCTFCFVVCFSLIYLVFFFVGLWWVAIASKHLYIAIEHDTYMQVLILQNNGYITNKTIPISFISFMPYQKQTTLS